MPLSLSLIAHNDTFVEAGIIMRFHATSTCYNTKENSTFLMHKQVNMPFCMQQQNAIIFQMRCFHRALFSQQNYTRVHFLYIFPRLPFIQHKLFDIDHSIHLSPFYPSFKSE